MKKCKRKLKDVHEVFIELEKSLLKRSFEERITEKLLKNEIEKKDVHLPEFGLSKWMKRVKGRNQTRDSFF